jgi:hypothetical protein
MSMLEADFPTYPDFLLRFRPSVLQDVALRERFASIAIGRGKKFDFKYLSLPHDPPGGTRTIEG